MFNFIDIYSFIPVSGCVGRGPSALLWPGPYSAVKMALFTIVCLGLIYIEKNVNVI